MATSAHPETRAAEGNPAAADGTSLAGSSAPRDSFSKDPASSGDAFRAFLREHRSAINEHVMASVPAPLAGEAEGATQQLNRYLYEPLRSFVASGGKRTRPALCLLGAQAVGADPSSAASVAAAVELFQSAALIHDDIADEGELRRGKPCVHVTEGVGVAINVGDLALVATTATLLRDDRLSDSLKLALLNEITAMEERTLEGQALDLGWARDERWDVSVDDYLYMASHKTAYYSAAVPLACGALCGGGTREQVEALRSFGMDAGLAFQLQDDLLNVVGDAASQGKDFRTDITEGKRTLMVVWSLEHLAPARRDELVAILSSKTSDPAKLARAVELMRESGAIEHTRAYASELAEHAKAHLDTIAFDKNALQTLRSMADFFVSRQA